MGVDGGATKFGLGQTNFMHVTIATNLSNLYPTGFTIKYHVIQYHGKLLKTMFLPVTFTLTGSRPY